MKLIPKQYIFNHKFFNEKAFIDYAIEKLNSLATPKWEKDIFHFVLEWMNEKDYVVVYTSGSTGKPKSIQLRKKWMENSAIQTCKYFGLDNKSTALLCLPASHIAGRMMMVRSFVAGFNLLTVEPGGNPFAGQNEKIDFAAITPFQLFQSLGSLRNNPPVKTLIVGGGDISNALEQEIKNLDIEIFATYGMTETSSHVALRRVNGAEKDNSFSVIGNTTIQTDERGCLVLENPELFEGTISTNDMVEITGEKRFRWLGRIDNIINSGGIKIIPEKIEQTISHLRQEEMIITWVPDDKLGQSVVLAVQAESLSHSQTQQLLIQLKEILQPYAVPRRIVCLAEFPKTANGKTDRTRIKQMTT